jgi:hypothetical protein
VAVNGNDFRQTAEQMEVNDLRYIASVLAATLCALCAACVPSVTLNPSVKGVNYKGCNIQIVVVDSIRFSYKGSLEDEFGKTNQYGKIKEFLGNSFRRVFADSAAVFRTRNEPANSFKLLAQRLTGGDTATVLLPDPKEPYRNLCDTCFTSQVTLFVEQLHISSNMEIQMVSVMGIPVAGIPQKPIWIRGKFIYWDNARNVPIAWKDVEASASDGATATLSTWRIASESFAMELIRKTPFDKSWKP